MELDWKHVRVSSSLFLFFYDERSWLIISAYASRCALIGEVGNADKRRRAPLLFASPLQQMHQLVESGSSIPSDWIPTWYGIPPSSSDVRCWKTRVRVHAIATCASAIDDIGQSLEAFAVNPRIQEA